jgi:phosphotransferase family enzyme
MSDRSVLGPADVSDDELAAMVAESLGVEKVDLLDSCAEVAPYDLEALTTAGRYWVHGRALADGEEVPFRFFVKVVQSWGRSPLFRFVPEPMRERALAMVPWRTEPEIYRSDLGERLPEGLRLPRAFAVRYLDDESAAVWLEALDPVDVPWDVDQHAQAAYLLGRLAASPRVRPLAPIEARGRCRTVRDYADGRVAQQVLPALRSDEVWQHPLVAATFDHELRDDLRAACDRLPGWLDELDAAPQTTSHGDACTRNLLVTAGQAGFVLIDFGFWGLAPVGFDLGQLVVAEVGMGERPAAELPALEAACLPAYVEGLRAEGTDVPVAVVERSHALLMMLFSGLSAVPFEFLDGPPSAERERISRERASSARWMLDREAATEVISS